MDRNLHTEIQIDATPSQVWTVLTDFPSYPRWNPFVRQISGDLVVGRRLQVALRQDQNRPALRIRPVVTVHRPERSFAWRGRLLLDSWFVGEHRFELESLDGGLRTAFVQSESFAGALVPLLWTYLDSKIRIAFESMNRALRAETLARFE